MNAELRKTVLDLLEVAHGYAILGSIWPMRKAAVECNIERSSEAWKAADAIVRAECPTDCKPSIDEYELALSRAVAKVEAMR